MNDFSTKESGWKPIPLSLKVLSGIFMLWILGSITGISMRYEEGLPFFGIYMTGLRAGLIVVILDILAPLAFLFALFTRRSWGPRLAVTYISIFILNGVVALFMFREQLGLPQILIPTTANIIFLGLIYRSKAYFDAS